MSEVLVQFRDGRADTWSETTPILGTIEEIARQRLIFQTAGFSHVMVWSEPNDISGIDRFAPVMNALRRQDVPSSGRSV